MGAERYPANAKQSERLRCSQLDDGFQIWMLWYMKFGKSELGHLEIRISEVQPVLSQIHFCSEIESEPTPARKRRQATLAAPRTNRERKECVKEYCVSSQSVLYLMVLGKHVQFFNEDHSAPCCPSRCTMSGRKSIHLHFLKCQEIRRVLCSLTQP